MWSSSVYLRRRSSALLRRRLYQEQRASLSLLSSLSTHLGAKVVGPFKNNNSNNNQHVVVRSFSRKTVNDNDNNNKKQNFDRTVLQPASRGELIRKHGSGIPRLAARKRKAHLTPVSGRAGTGSNSGADEEESEPWEEDTSLLHSPRRQETNPVVIRSDTSNSGFRMVQTESVYDDLSAFCLPYDQHELQRLNSYYAPELLNDEKYYWREEDYDDFETATTTTSSSILSVPPVLFPDKQPKAVVADEDDDDNDEDGDLEDDPVMDLENLFKDREDRKEKERLANVAAATLDAAEAKKQGEEKLDANQVRYLDPFDPFNLVKQGDQLKELHFPDLALPLRPHGPSMGDFLQAMAEHPTKYAQVYSPCRHPESLREPQPIGFVPKHKRRSQGSQPRRANPSLDFVQRHARFLYVTGLPPLEIDGEPGDIANPIHRRFLQKSVAQLVGGGVDSESAVSPANATSAFVGFESPKQLALALARGPTEPSLTIPPTIRLYSSSNNNNNSGEKGEREIEFVSKTTNPDCIVDLSSIPAGNTPQSLVETLFPHGTDVGSIYGDSLSLQDDICFLSSTRVLIRFPSTQQAESAVSSHLVQARLAILGDYPIRYYRARRELVHDGFNDPWTKYRERRKLGPRLIVDSDMPSKTFYRSHGGVVHVRHLDFLPDVFSNAEEEFAYKQEISSYFQKFCARRRDIKGSIEFITCEAGMTSGEAFVGFDLPGEAEAVLKATSGLLQMDQNSYRPVNLRLVRDRQIPGQPLKLDKRPERSVEELLDDLNNWERYVDPADIQLLEEHGINKVVLDEALRSIRYRNKTFGAFDASIRAEALEPDKERGEQYRELVEMYVATLKECLATPDDVGETYEGLHFPGEDIDLSIFDREKERQEKLMKLRSEGR